LLAIATQAESCSLGTTRTDSSQLDTWMQLSILQHHTTIQAVSDADNYNLDFGFSWKLSSMGVWQPALQWQIWTL